MDFQKQLDWQKVGVTMPVGLKGVELKAAQDYTRDLLAYQLTAYVMTDKAGEQCSAAEHVRRKVKPRWLPRWLWDRIYEEVVIVTATTTPNWSYPSANIDVPELGAPVRFAVTNKTLDYRQG